MILYFPGKFYFLPVEESESSVSFAKILGKIDQFCKPKKKRTLNVSVDLNTSQDDDDGLMRTHNE